MRREPRAAVLPLPQNRFEISAPPGLFSKHLNFVPQTRRLSCVRPVLVFAIFLSIVARPGSFFSH